MLPNGLFHPVINSHDSAITGPMTTPRFPAIVIDCAAGGNTNKFTGNGG